MLYMWSLGNSMGAHVTLNRAHTGGGGDGGGEELRGGGTGGGGN